MDVNAVAYFIDRYGLPLAILAVFGWLLITRRLILGSEKDRSDAVNVRELEYREARRVEERSGRLEAEAALHRMAEAMEALSAAVNELSDLISSSSLPLREARREQRR